MDSRRPGEEPQPTNPNTATDAAQPAGERAAAPPQPAARRSPSEATRGNAADPNAAAAINAKLAQLEEHLKGIGKTLTLHMGKEDVVTRSLVELESKIRKIERSLQETIPAAAPAVPGPPMERGPNARPTAGAAVDETPQRGQLSTRAATHGLGREPSDQLKPAQDFSYTGHADPDEPSSFFSESPDVFEEPPEIDQPLHDNDRFTRAGGEGRRPLRIIIPVLCLLALFLFLVYYYNNLQKPGDNKLTITEQISVSSIPVETVTSQPEPAGEPPKTEPAPARADSAPSAPAAPPAPVTDDAAVLSSVPSSIPATMPSPTQPAAKGFAVSVGAFKEKSNAIDLTSRLTGKGYPAQMALSKPKKLFRVTVGSFENRREAAAMAAQIQKKERLNTAIIDLGKP